MIFKRPKILMGDVMSYQFMNSAFTIAFLALLSGCAIFDKDLSANGIVTVEPVSSQNGLIEKVSVTQRGTTTWITGYVTHSNGRSSEANPQHLPDHVDIQLIGPTGELVFSANIPHRRVHQKSISFEFELAVRNLIEPGSVVRVIHDEESVTRHIKRP